MSRHVQRPQPGEGPDIGPRPHQATGVSRHAQHATPDPEGTGVWTPDWDGDDEPERPPRQHSAQGAAHARHPHSDLRTRGDDLRTRGDDLRTRGGQAGQALPGQGPPRNPGEASTDFIPRQHGREQLFTHQEPLPPPSPPGPPRPPGPRPGGPANTRLDAKDAELLRRRRLWRRVRRVGYALGLLLFLGPIVAFLIGYYAWDVPNAAVLGASSNSQIVTVYYADGQTELAKLMPPKAENRVNVELEHVPKHVQDAVLAAEDRSYWSNPGFDPIGIGRAVFKQATGGAGGGSTITQQYVKVATQEDDFSLRRKFRELVWSIKIAQQYSKQDILENYLNIVYFGRQAYGIQAASQSYFGKDVSQLNPSEGALLAGMIQSPSRSDPAKNRPRAEARWNFVLNGMVSQGWLDASQRSTAPFPEVVPLEQIKGGAVTDHRLHIQEQAIAELEAEHFDTATVHEYGGKIITTIDPRAQEAAVKAVAEVLNGQPQNLKSALVAVDPKSGAVRAYYGGNEGTGIDLANSQFSPGSSFKAFVMLAALGEDKGLSDQYPGGSPLEIGGVTFNNSESANYGSLSLKQAMTFSVNTTFVQLTHELGTQSVVDAAHNAGIPETIDGKRTLVNADGTAPGLAIALGALPVRALDMASAYATFAGGGVKHQPFLVTEYKNAAGQVLYKHQTSPPENALDPQNPERNAQLACNVTESLRDVPTHSKFELSGKREAAAKTGTDQRGKTDENDNSWTVGYTPSISAAVWVGDPAQTAIKTKDNRNVFGSTFAGPIWKRFMDAHLGTIKASDDKFPDCKPIKEEVTTTAPPPPPSSSPTKPGRQKPPDPTTSPTEITRVRPPRGTTEPCLPLLCPPPTTTAESSTTSQSQPGR